jgi:hypothetical protein
VVDLEAILKAQSLHQNDVSFLFLFVLQQTAHFLTGLAFFSEGRIFSTKFLAVSPSGASVFDGLPGGGGGGSKTYLCTSNNSFII